MRNVIFIAAIILAVIILVFVILDGSFLKKKYRKTMSEKGINSQKNDLDKIISYSIGASSGHNMQPWLVKRIDKNAIQLYADMQKQLPIVDNANKQLLMSQGTFVEKFRQGADSLGYEILVNYADINLEEQMPLIATLKINKTEQGRIDAVTGSTVVSDNSNEVVDVQKTVREAVGKHKGFSYQYINSGSEFEKLQDVLLQGTIIESKDAEATIELINAFRFTEWDKNKYRYGLSLNAFPVIVKPFIQPIMNMTSSNYEAFGESSISVFKDRLKKDVGYILIKKDNPSNIDYAYAGEIYSLLIKETKGYELRPAVQVLEDFDAIRDLNIQFQNTYGTDGQVLLILCVQKREGKIVKGNPRHLIEDILIK